MSTLRLLRKVKSTLSGRDSHGNNYSSPTNPTASPPPQAALSQSSSSRGGANNSNSAPDLSARYRHSTQRLRKPNERVLTLTSRPRETLPLRRKNQLLSAQQSEQQEQGEGKDHPHPLSEFRRLIRKASTFSLRAKKWRGERNHTSVEAAKAEERCKENNLLDGEDATDLDRTHQRLQSIAVSTVKSTFTHEGQAKSGSGFKERDLDFGEAVRQAIHKHQRNFTNTSSISTIQPAVTTATTRIDHEQDEAADWGAREDIFNSNSQRSQLQGPQRDNKSRKGYRTEIRVMAAEHATPPVPYTRLKEITESVSPSSPH